ncbi:MAG TPA: protein-L-isoaspartate O-methyltransferase [Alphaproteobacteria bacterium]|nr:protein-L-isoaspartate O-methyltransferase [Alphaproteobacteria bacterium]
MDFAAARRNMVDRQLRTNKVTDEAVLEALGRVPRERFVPEGLRGAAYIDEDLPLGNGRYLIEPMAFGRLLQAAQIKRTDLVLDLGCGPGYSTAILSHLANMVVALECDGTLARRAGAALSELALDNAVVVEGPLEQGWPAQAPYDVVMLGGAAARIPEALLGQLAEGGRLAGVEMRGRVGRAVLYARYHGSISGRTLFDAAVPLLPGLAEEPSFVF